MTGIGIERLVVSKILEAILRFQLRIVPALP